MFNLHKQLPSPVGKVTYGEIIQPEPNVWELPITVTWNAADRKAWLKSLRYGRYVKYTSANGGLHMTWVEYKWWQLLGLQPVWWFKRLKRKLKK